MDVITKSTQCPVAYMGIAASKFVLSKESGSFLKFFKTVKPENNGKVNHNTDQLETSSSGGKTNFKSNFEVTEVRSPAVIDSKDQSLKTKKAEPLVIVIDQEEPNQTTATVAIEKSVTIINEVAAKGNKMTDNSLNTKAEDSPTSREVFKLMQVCKERDEAKSKIKRMSSMTINNNDFQNSFFMNIFKTDKKDHSENVNDGSDTAEESEQSERSTVSSTKNLDTSNDTDNNNSDLCMRDNDHEKPSSSRTSTLVHSKDEDSSEKELKEESTAHTPMLLREIFPNLDDMDPDILLLLPPDLQEEARSYARARDNKRENLAKISRDLPAKTAKGKSGKSKAVSKTKHSPLLDNFLIKTNSSEPLERCTECGQMIPVTRYGEHTDFHVAQNLYQEINKPENSVKRKLQDAEVVVTSVKRQPNNCKLDRDSEPITTFLS